MQHTLLFITHVSSGNLRIAQLIANMISTLGKSVKTWTFSAERKSYGLSKTRKEKPFSKESKYNSLPIIIFNKAEIDNHEIQCYN